MKKFIKFLEDHNAWENFEREFKNYGRVVKEYKKLFEREPEAALSSAFKWSETKDGISYWSRLNDEWLKENVSLKVQLLSDD